MSGYKPEITVVRRGSGHQWARDDGGWDESAEGAYLVRGLPMPGEKVMVVDGMVGTVYGLTPSGNIEVTYGTPPLHGYWLPACIAPFDPEAEKVERVARALHGSDWPTVSFAQESPRIQRRYREKARIAVAAMKATP